MQTERGKLFDEREPELSDDEVSKAYEDGKIAASFKGKPVVTSPENIGFIAVKFAFHDGSHGTMLLDYFAARVLRSLIDSVDEIGWKTAAAKPGEAVYRRGLARTAARLPAHAAPGTRPE